MNTYLIRGKKNNEDVEIYIEANTPLTALFKAYDQDIDVEGVYIQSIYYIDKDLEEEDEMLERGTHIE